ncbi:SIMPL domain-containing protein [Vaginella massiliensis]|uniref:SIMPL domain-containing protein n=1 Tax=Vaginella massiliensis TaxID=1816680 RepID=UPI0008397124|nr:SIMPL domain-containing protein [Vaginella massiliensis]
MKNYYIITSAIAAVAIILAALFLGSSYKYKYKSQDRINVVGNAKQDFESDLIVWSGSFMKKDYDLKTASEALNSDKVTVLNYLKNKGIKENEITFDAVQINRDFNYITREDGSSYREFTGYELTQFVTIESKEIDRIEKVSREITDLISQGIELNSSQPSYYYSKLEDLKLELIKKASENGRQRAENIASESKASLGSLRNADLGIFQITGQNSNEDYSYGGAFNTTSRAKTANITVRLSYQAK